MEHTDLGLIIAIVCVGSTIVGVVIAMMFWYRSESNSLSTSLRNEAKEDLRELLQISRNLDLVVDGMDRQMRDFHNRLLEIELRKHAT